MRIVLPGGTGQVGRVLCRAFSAAGHEVVVLSRGSSGHSLSRTVVWDGRTLGDWQREIDGADAVINLAGYTVNCRYTPENRARILHSRVESTRVVGQAIAAARRPPRVWLQASTATIYAHRFDAPNDETGIVDALGPEAPDTWRFSVDVAKAWEHELEQAATPHTRKVAMRSSMIMSADRGGIFDVLRGLVRKGLGGTAGSGRQYVSWIHGRDFVRAVDWLLTDDALTGPINIAGPEPLPYAAFMKELRAACGVPFGLPASTWMLEVGAIFMRTETELVLKSRRVIPGRLLDHGFRFDFPTWQLACRDLCEQAREPGLR